MDFQLNDDQLTLRQAARDFAQTEMTAIARELEEANEPLGRDHLKRYAEM